MKKKGVLYIIPHLPLFYITTALLHSYQIINASDTKIRSLHSDSF